MKIENYHHSTSRNLIAFREYRKHLFKAFDVWEKAVIVGREQTNEEVYKWYNDMLNFTVLINEKTKSSDFPKVPACILKYRS